MQSLWLITQKNIKLLLRSKGSALIVIFAPLLIILILGLSYNTTSKYGLTIGLTAAEFTEELNEFSTFLEEKEFIIKKYPGDSKECIDDIKSGAIHTCLELPATLKVSDNAKREIIFHVDPSRIQLVHMIQQNLQSKFSLKAQEISQSLTENILTKLSSAQTVVGDEKGKISGVKDRSASASASAEAARKKITSIDTKLPETDYNSTILSSLKNDLDKARLRISSSLSFVNSSDLNGTSKTELNEKLIKAKNAVIDVRDALDNGSVDSFVAVLKKDLDEVRGKLSAAAISISDAGATLETAKGTLAESTETLNGIVGALDTLVASLNDQPVTEAGTIAAPLTTVVNPVKEEGSYLNYLFPAILVLVVMFSSLLLGTTLVMMEKNSPAFIRNFFLPISKSTFIISTYLTSVILTILQLLVILLISLFFLKDVISLLPSVFLVLFVSASIFSFLGMVIGYLFSSEETAVLASISLGSILLFLSGILLPLEGISPLLRQFTSLNPFVVTENIVRNIFLFSSPLQEVWFELVMLVAVALVLFLIILIIESTLHQHLMKRFLKGRRTRKAQRPSK